MDNNLSQPQHLTPPTGLVYCIASACWYYYYQCAVNTYSLSVGCDELIYSRRCEFYLRELVIWIHIIIIITFLSYMICILSLLR